MTITMTLPAWFVGILAVVAIVYVVTAIAEGIVKLGLWLMGRRDRRAGLRVRRPF